MRAHALTMVPTSSDHQRLFRYAQSVLIHSISADLPLPDDVRKKLDRLVRLEPTEDPERTVVDADELWTRLARKRLTDADHSARP
jgi:hypothetical protein